MHWPFMHWHFHIFSVLLHSWFLIPNVWKMHGNRNSMIFFFYPFYPHLIMYWLWNPLQVTLPDLRTSTNTWSRPGWAGTPVSSVATARVRPASSETMWSQNISQIHSLTIVISVAKLSGPTMHFYGINAVINKTFFLKEGKASLKNCDMSLKYHGKNK